MLVNILTNQEVVLIWHLVNLFTSKYLDFAVISCTKIQSLLIF